MAYGPAELIVVKFPGNQFRGEIAPALGDLIDAGTIRLIDLLFVMKDTDGSVTYLEAGEVFPDGPLAGVLAESDDGFISDEDVDDIAPEIEPGSSAAVMLFEHLWAAEFTQAIRNAGGELIYNERIPAAVVEEVARART
ncbi:MAG: DUF6325 family protein [Candidatus Limnocylindrales bacterium]|jgi:uncharacterized membrane protein